MKKAELQAKIYELEAKVACLTYIVFDQDASMLEGFKTYEW